MHSETLGAAFLDVAERDDVIVRFWQSAENAPCFTYGQFAEDALLVAGALQAEGFLPGERVAIVLPTHPDFYRAYFGIILAGGVPVPLYPPVRLGRIDEWKSRTAAMLRASSAVAVITELRLLGLLGSPVKNAAPRLGCRTVPGLLKEKRSGTPILGESGDIATVQFSSGSTGDPKPVALSHLNMMSNVEAIMSTFPLPLEQHSGVSWLPLYHDMGLIGNMLLAMIGKGDLTLIGPERFVTRPRIWFEALTATRGTISAAPNFAFGLCTARIAEDDLDGLDLSNWRLALCGAEPVHPRTLSTFAERFGKIGFAKRSLLPVYGLAEASLAATFSDVDEEPLWTSFDADALDSRGEALRVNGSCGRNLCSVGTPLPGVKLAIRDEEDNDLPHGKVGAIWLKGSGIMTGYLDRPDHNAKVFRNGWLDTGDLGFVYGGELYLCGRRKDLIIIRGRNYDPSIVEQAVDGIKGLRTGCAVAFGVDNPEDHTERLVVLAEERKESRVAHETLAALAAQEIRGATGLNPEQVVILRPGTLPRTSSGKIRRAEARRRWLAGELTAPAKASSRVMLKETVLGLANQLGALINRCTAKSDVVSAWQVLEVHGKR